jgi:hypothetical protein
LVLKSAAKNEKAPSCEIVISAAEFAAGKTSTGDGPGNYRNWVAKTAI